MEKKEFEKVEIDEIHFDNNDDIVTQSSPKQQDIGPITADPGTEVDIP